MPHNTYSRTGPSRAFVALGANLGDRRDSIERACWNIDALNETQVVSLSPVYETEPEDPADGGLFLNCVIEIKTVLAPMELIAEFQAIERALGRTNAVSGRGPRPIDLDLLSYGDIVRSGADLTLPHPRAHERPFVLLPWADIAPEYFIPVLNVSVQKAWIELHNQIGEENGIVRKIDTLRAVTSKLTRSQ